MLGRTDHSFIWNATLWNGKSRGPEVIERSDTVRFRNALFLSFFSASSSINGTAINQNRYSKHIRAVSFSRCFFFAREASAVDVRLRRVYGDIMTDDAKVCVGLIENESSPSQNIKITVSPNRQQIFFRSSIDRDVLPAPRHHTSFISKVAG